MGKATDRPFRAATPRRSRLHPTALLPARVWQGRKRYLGTAQIFRTRLGSSTGTGMGELLLNALRSVSLLSWWRVCHRVAPELAPKARKPGLSGRVSPRDSWLSEAEGGIRAPGTGSTCSRVRRERDCDLRGESGWLLVVDHLHDPKLVRINQQILQPKPIRPGPSLGIE